MGAVDQLYGLYRRLPIGLQNLLVSGYGWVLHRRRYGPEHDSMLRLLLDSVTWDRQRQREYQLERLKETLIYAQKFVPYYRDLWGRIGFDARDLRRLEEIRQLPITEKDEIKKDPMRFVSDHYQGAKLHKGSTSGTTGKPVTTFKEPATYKRTWAFLTRMRRQWGILGKEPRVSIGVRQIVPMGETRPPFWRHDRTEDNWLFSNFHISDATIDAYVDKIAEIRPEEINAYPSGVSLVAARALQRGVDTIRPKTVITCAETLYAEQRRQIEEAFGCKVADQYGAAEAVFWAHQCPHGTYHISPEFGLLESVRGTEPIAGEVGDALGTGFVNKVQVLIRYRIGDSILLPTESPLCPCGWQSETLDLIIGRIDDILYSPDGRALGRLDIVLKKIEGVSESQLVQDERDHLIVNLVAEEEPIPTVEETIRERITDYFGPEMRIDFRWVETIPRTKAGKFRYQVNKIGRPNETVTVETPNH